MEKRIRWCFGIIDTGQIKPSVDRSFWIFQLETTPLELFMLVDHLLVDWVEWKTKYGHSITKVSIYRNEGPNSEFTEILQLYPEIKWI